MSNLDWVFSLYAVVLGLTLTEILTGFARAIRFARDARLSGQSDMRLGVLTPLLALFLMADVTSFWIVGWSLRDAIEATPPVMAFGLLVTGLYYVAASWVFPEAANRYQSLDEYYYRHKAPVFALIFASNVAGYAGRGWVIGDAGVPGFSWFDYALMLAYYLLQAAGIFAKGKGANLAILTGLIVLSLDFFFGLIAFIAQLIA